jgi:basic amino acid/polyamine antiporter, APA family
VALITSVGLVNIRAVRVSSRLSVVVSAVALVAQIGLAVLGLALVFEPSVLREAVQLDGGAGLSGLAFALPIAMIAFTGLDAMANLSGELRNPERLIARPMIISAIVSVVMLVGMSALALSAMPVTGSGANADTALARSDEAGGFIDRPLVGVVQNLPVSSGVEDALSALVAILAAIVLFLIANVSLNGLSRLVYAMSVNRQLPSALTRIDRKTGVPAVAVGVFSLVSIGLLVLTETLRSSALVLAQLYAFGAMLSLTVAIAAVIRLRYREPDMPRPVKAGLNIRVGGGEISLVAVAGLVAAFGVWLLVLFTHDAARVLGMIWMVAGFVLYGTYRVTHGHGLRATAEQHATREVQIEASQYNTILLAMRPEKGKLWGSGDAELAALAYKLLDDRTAGKVAAMLVHELPLTVALNADIGSDEQLTTKRLTLLRAVTDKLGVRLTSTIMRARAAGRAICQEAERRDVDAVVMATRLKRRTDDLVFGKTVSYVLRHAPCDVVILSFPPASLKAVDRSAQAAAARRESRADASSRVRST